MRGPAVELTPVNVAVLLSVIYVLRQYSAIFVALVTARLHRRRQQQLCRAQLMSLLYTDRTRTSA